MSYGLKVWPEDFTNVKSKPPEAALLGKRETRVPMCYRDFLSDPEAGIEPCHPLSPEERLALAEGIQELFEAERMLS